MGKVSIKIHDDSHLDHGVNDRVLAWIETLLVDAQAVEVNTLTLRDDMPDLESALYGPAAGDSPVLETSARYRKRKGRDIKSRVLPGCPPRPTRLITVVTGPHDGQQGVLFTCYGGPEAPREIGDIDKDDPGFIDAVKFWGEHALSAPLDGE
jgi:hypothetical protein